MNKIRKSVNILDRAIASIKADLQLDPLVSLTVKQCELVKAYREKTEPIQQWQDYLNENPTPELLLERAGLELDGSETEAQQVYQREVEAFAKHMSRRHRKGSVK